MSMETLILLIVSLVIGYKLLTVLGQNNDDESFSNPSSHPAVEPSKDILPAGGVSGSAGASVVDNLENYNYPSHIHQVLVKVQAHYQRFSPATFLKNAEKVFERVVASFNSRNAADITGLLNDAMANKIKQVWDADQQQQRNREVTLINVGNVALEDAWIDDDTAFLDVRYESSRVVVIRDQAGTIVAGSPHRYHDMAETWTFSRRLKSKRPNWLVVNSKIHYDRVVDDAVKPAASATAS